MATAPITVSSQTRSKLEVFRYDKSLQKVSFSQNDAIKEKRAVGKENLIHLGHRGLNADTCSPSQVKSLSQCSGKRERKECPQTPNGRLPLAELIANGEDAGRLPSLTPVEHVSWNCDLRGAGFMSSSATPSSQNGKRRRNGTSPASSSQKEASNHFHAATLTADSHLNQQSQETPQADPASDLWYRYSLNPKGNITEPEPTFQQLIQSSSPDICSKQIGSSDTSGLRRSMSCGTEWPTSAAKRRKIHRSKTISRGDEYVATFEVAIDNPLKSTSRVKFLVERVQDVLAAPTKDGTEPSPSSSLPLPYDAGPEGEASPLRRFEAKPRLGAAPVSQYRPLYVDEAGVENYMELTSNTDISQERNDTSNLSDFGEDEIDLEALVAVDGSDEDSWQNTVVSELRQDVPVQNENISHFDSDQTDPNLAINQTTEPNPPERIYNGERRLSVDASTVERARDARKADIVTVIESDEFDEDDSEVLAADLEDVAALYDCGENLGLQATGEETLQTVEYRTQQFAPLLMGDRFNDDENGHKGMTRNVVQVSFDEEFGNDDDFEQLIDECAKASQVHSGPTPIHSSVRSVYFGPSI